MNESIQQLKYIKEKLIHVSKTSDRSVTNDVQILEHCITRIESQWLHLASCIKSEEEVRAIMKDCMKPMVMQLTNEIMDNAEKKFLAATNALTIEIKALRAFKDYFDNLYGQGLEVANFHLNGDLEPFDNFYDSAIAEYVKKGTEDVTDINVGNKGSEVKSDVQ